MLNAALYPKGAPLAPARRPPATAEPAPTAADIRPPRRLRCQGRAADAAAPASSRRTARRLTAIVQIQVKRADGAKLKAAVKAAKLSKSIKRKLRTRRPRPRSRWSIKGVRTSDEHARKAWVSRIKNGLDRRKVKPIYALRLATQP